MRLQDLNWMDVARYLERDNRIILVTGATEQHSYLSLMTDVLIPSRVALAVAERENVLCAPALNFGVSDFFADFPGTVSLSAATFEAVISDILFSLYHQGFSRFLVVNGHGGNALPQRLKDLSNDGAARVVWFDWWRNAAVQAFEAEHALKLDHANWGENFSFTRVADVPSGIKPPVNLALIDEGQPTRDVLADGSFGGPYQVEDGLMNALFWAVVEEVTRLVRTL